MPKSYPGLGRPLVTPSVRTALVSLLMLAAVGCQQPEQEESTTPATPTTEVPAVAASTSPEPTVSDVFQPASPDPSISRENIPSIIDEMVSDYGRVIVRPESYDPSKPNLYIVPRLHFKDLHEQDPRLYAVQDQCVRIFHEMRKLGVETNFLEGAPSMAEIKHNERFQREGWPSFDSGNMPQYKATGEFRRGDTVIEYIYEDAVQTFGAEPVEYAEIRSEWGSEKPKISRIMANVISQVATALSIEHDPSTLGNRASLRALGQQIHARVGNDPALMQSLFETYVAGNADFCTHVEAAAKYFYYQINGRNQGYADTIASSDTGQDKFFAVGTWHALGTESLVEDHNVFVILPNAVPEESLSNYPSPNRVSSVDEAQDYWLRVYLQDLGLMASSQ